MNFSTAQAQISSLTEGLQKFAAIVDGYSDDKVGKELFLTQLERYEKINWVEENIFNQLLAYYILGSAYSALKRKELDYSKAYYTNTYVYKEISYYHNIQYVVSRVHMEQWANLFVSACRIYTKAYLCLANAYDHQGRFCEAQQYYKLASKMKENQTDIEINQGFSYANMHTFWEHEEPWIIKRAQKLFALHPNEIDEHVPGLRDRINKLWVPQQDERGIEFNLVAEKDYEKWVNDNYLRLNRYCDVEPYSTLSLEDNVVLSSIEDTKDRVELFSSMYDEISSSFLHTRHYLYYDIICASEIELEIVKMIFKNFYSILDKIAMFISVYLNLPIKVHNIDFSKIWTYKKDKKESIRNEFLSLENTLPIVALYNIKLDVYGSNIQEYIIDQQTKDLKRLRNFMEHKFIKIDEGPLSNNDYQLTISGNELILNTVRLTQLVRCAIIYLCNFIMQHEAEKGN